MGRIDPRRFERVKGARSLTDINVTALSHPSSFFMTLISYLTREAALVRNME